MPVCYQQFYGHEAPDDRLAEDDRVILKAGDEEQDEDDLAQKLDDAGQQGQHLLAHALQSVAGGEQHSQHGVEGCVPDQIPRAVFQHHRLRRAGHQLYHPLCACRHEQDSSRSHHDTVEIDVPHSAADAVGMVRAVVLGDVGRAGRGHRRQGHIREREELSGCGVARDDQGTEAVDAVLQNDRACRDDAADLLEDMPAGVVKRVLEKSSKQTRESLNKLLNYPESSAGSLMTPEYVRLKKEMNVRQALDAIRRQGENAETVYINYVVERNRLKGVVSARDLLLADPDTPLVDIMDDNVVTVKVTDDQEFVAREMQRYDFTAMPVVDNEGMFVGIITIDDAIDVLTDESTEDMQKMAAILPADEATTYFGTSVWTHAKQRIPWLLILMLSATFTGMVTTHYEEAFVSLPLLVSFMPMLMDTAGNCGNQISTLMVRGLALGEVEPADFLKVLAKELRVSAIVGAVLGVVNGLRIYLMYTFIFAGQYDNVMGYAIVVSVSLFFSVILAKLVGGMLPLAAKKLGADPAIMATPFITTIVDACSLILYFQIAQIVFRNMM